MGVSSVLDQTALVNLNDAFLLRFSLIYFMILDIYLVKLISTLIDDKLSWVKLS